MQCKTNGYWILFAAVLGLVLLLVGFICICCCCCVRKRRKQRGYKQVNLEDDVGSENVGYYDEEENITEAARKRNEIANKYGLRKDESVDRGY